MSLCGKFLKAKIISKVKVDNKTIRSIKNDRIMANLCPLKNQSFLGPVLTKIYQFIYIPVYQER